jgi:hypothetical protein
MTMTKHIHIEALKVAAVLFVGVLVAMALGLI